MNIERFSLKALTVTVLSIIGIVAIATSFVSEGRYRHAAIEAQTRTVTKILKVVTEAVFARIKDDSVQFTGAAARALQSHPGLEAYLSEAPADTDNPALGELLQAPLKAKVADVHVVSVALYNQAGEKLMSRGQNGNVTASLLKARRPDQVVSGFWSGAEGARFTVVQPLGGKRAQGYLSICFDPVYALRSVARLIDSPLRIKRPGGDKPLYVTDDWDSTSESNHEIDYPLVGMDGDTALELAVQDDFSALNRATRETRNATTLAFLALIGAALFIAILILNRFLFQPLNNMIRDMQRVSEGDVSTSIDTRALREFHILADAFNTMTGHVRGIIERERQSAEDIKGKVELIQDVVSMAAKGDLTGEIMVYRDHDVISELATGIQQMLASLNSLVARIQQSGVQVTSSATEIAATAKEQEATVTEQAATTNQIKATVTEITATAKELVNTMSDVTDVAWKTSESANAGRSSLSSMENTMHQMMEATESISSKLAVLSEKAGNINTVVTTINRVADQTNLLSLNAAIEAEKAGEYGVGFAVVATEIRRLADQTAVATWDIEQMVKEMQSAVSAGVMGMEKFSEEVRRGVDDVRQVGSQLAHIIEQVETLIPRFDEVNQGMASQSQSAQQIRDAIVQLSESAQQTADSLRQSNGAILQLNEAAGRLQQGASNFRVNT